MNRLIIWCKYYKLFFYILEGYLKYVKQNECVLKPNQCTEFDFIYKIVLLLVIKITRKRVHLLL